jgi:hypothetical protein
LIRDKVLGSGYSASWIGAFGSVLSIVRLHYDGARYYAIRYFLPLVVLILN